jgi:hypothetical protein
LGSDVCKLFDLGGRVLDLLIGELEPKLLHSRLDSVPSGETVSDGDVASEPEVFGLEDLICTRVIEDGLGVNTSLVREGTVATVENR